jgi:hypothetical protein
MTYVVVIERDDGTKDFKSFTQSADAIKRHSTACRYVHSREPISVSGKDETIIVSCQMFRANTQDAREAVNLVKEGKAEILHPEVHYRQREDAPSIDDL